LAHVILRHFSVNGSDGQREREDSADAQGAHLARCAGYDVQGALGFWTRYAAQDPLSFLRSGSHRSPEKRSERISQQLAEAEPC